MDILLKKTHRRALVLLFITAILWSFGGLLIKLIDWHPMAIAGMRSLIAIPLISIMVKRKHITYSMPQILGAIFYSVNVILFVAATKLTTAANAILIQYTAPIYVALFSVALLGEKIKKYDWVVISTALLGMVLFFFDKLSVGNFFGNILAAISGLSFGFFIIFMRMQKDSFPLASIFIGNIITVVVALPFMFYSAPKDLKSWTGLILLGTIQLGLSHILYSSAIKHVTALQGVMVPLVEPILNPLWVLLFVGERPQNWALAGGVVVMVSLIIHLKIALKNNSNPFVKAG